MSTNIPAPKNNVRKITEVIYTQWIPTYPRRAVAYWRIKPHWNAVWVERETEVQALAELLELLPDHDVSEAEILEAHAVLEGIIAADDGFPRGKQK